MFRLFLTLAFMSFALSNTQYFNKDEKDPELTRPNLANYSSCREFLNNTEFDAMKVIDTDWKIFYFFNPEFEKSYKIRFSLPSATLIQHFKKSLDERFNPKLNWSAAELFMESTIDISALFIRTNVSGLYQFVSTLDFYEVMDPVQEFALKLVEPGILGFVNCLYRRAFALAPSDRMPSANEIDEAAAKINFRSDYKQSYLKILEPQPRRPSTTRAPYKDTVDDREDYRTLDEDRADALYLF